MGEAVEDGCHQRPTVAAANCPATVRVLEPGAKSPRLASNRGLVRRQVGRGQAMVGPAPDDDFPRQPGGLVGLVD